MPHAAGLDATPRRAAAPAREPHPAAWVALWAALAAVCAAPVLLNGGAMVFTDTQNYITTARMYRPSHMQAFGYAAWLGATGGMAALWLTAAAQALCAAYVLTRWFALESARWPARWRLPVAAALVAAAAITHLPWLASWLMPDLFTGLLLVTLLILAEHWRALPWWERVLFLVFALGAATTHLTHPPLFLGLGLFALVVFLLRPARRARGAVGRTAVLALAVAVVGWGALVASNWITYRQATTSLGQSTFLFGRLNADGDIRPVLRPHCEAGARWVVCGYLERLVGLSEDQFLWYDEPVSPLTSMGYISGFYEEARVLNPLLLRAYWPDWLAASAHRALRQMTRFELGDGMDAQGPQMLVRDLGRFGIPGPVPGIAASRQYENGLQPWMPRALAWAAGAAGLLALAAFAGFGLARRRPDLWWPALLFLAVWVGNAALVGLASEVHGRYGARLAWLAPLLAILLALRWAVVRPDPRDVEV